MDIFKRNGFIVQRNPLDLKDIDKITVTIMDMDMRVLCYIRYHYNWRRYEVWVPSTPILNILYRILSRPFTIKKTRQIDIRYETAGSYQLGEIQCIPILYWLRPMQKYHIFDANGVSKGTVRESLTLKTGHRDWVLDDSPGKLIGTIKGKWIEHDYEVLAPDGQSIARCYPEEAVGQGSFRLDILESRIDPFVALSLSVVLNLEISYTHVPPLTYPLR